MKQYSEMIINALSSKQEIYQGNQKESKKINLVYV